MKQNNTQELQEEIIRAANQIGDVFRKLADNINASKPITNNEQFRRIQQIAQQASKDIKKAVKTAFSDSL